MTNKSALGARKGIENPMAQASQVAELLREMQHMNTLHAYPGHRLPWPLELDVEIDMLQQHLMNPATNIIDRTNMQRRLQRLQQLPRSGNVNPMIIHLANALTSVRDNRDDERMAFAGSTPFPAEIKSDILRLAGLPRHDYRGLL